MIAQAGADLILFEFSAWSDLYDTAGVFTGPLADGLESTSSYIV
jgi:hypothetical protein